MNTHTDMENRAQQSARRATRRSTTSIKVLARQIRVRAKDLDNVIARAQDAGLEVTVNPDALPRVEVTDIRLKM